MSHSEPAKIIIFAVYFGPLPHYFPLWLKSCGFNCGIDWCVVTDQASPVDLPANVEWRHSSLAETVQRIADAAGETVTVNNAYKLCDLRPLYWTLIDPGQRCDFWGHCDLDMIFGDLQAFLTPELLARHDKIFSVGHLTLYRNSPETNRFYRKPHPDLDYRAVLADPAPRGFDEHTGVNRIWRRHSGRFHADESVVADIDPHIRRFERSSNYHHFRNHRHQAFLFDRGKIKRLYWHRGRLLTEEFIYIHFQKRRLPPSTLPAGAKRFYITPAGFIEAGNMAADKAELDRLNGGFPLTMSEIRHRLRRLKRRIFPPDLTEDVVA